MPDEQLPQAHAKRKLVVDLDDLGPPTASRPLPPPLAGDPPPPPPPPPLPAAAPGLGLAPAASIGDVAIRVLGGAAIVAFIAVLLPWYRADASFGQSLTASGWSALPLGGRFILAASILLALACAADLFGGLAGRDPLDRRDLGHHVAVAGALAAVYVLGRLIVKPTFYTVTELGFGTGSSSDTQVTVTALSGAFLELVAVAVIAAAGYALAHHEPGGFDPRHAWALVTERGRRQA